MDWTIIAQSLPTVLQATFISEHRYAESSACWSQTLRSDRCIPSECRWSRVQKWLAKFIMQGSRRRALLKDKNNPASSTSPTSIPPKHVPVYNLRPRVHQCQLPNIRDNQVSRNYMINMMIKMYLEMNQTFRIYIVIVIQLSLFYIHVIAYWNFINIHSIQFVFKNIAVISVLCILANSTTPESKNGAAGLFIFKIIYFQFVHIGIK